MFHAKWRLSSAARKLVRSLVALVLVTILVSCGDRAQTSQESDSLKSFSTQQATNIAEVSPPLVIQELRQLLENNQPQVTILSPKANEVYQNNTISAQFQVKDLPIFQNPELGMGLHLHVFLDNHSYQAVYDLKKPLVLKDLEPGTHTLRVFASRPWHESFKNEGAYAQTTFHIFTATNENSPDPDRPLLTYSRPQGSYGAEPIMLDFYLTNAPLHVVARENLEDDIADWKIRCTINGKSFVIDRWQPIYLTGFSPGNNWVQLELIDAKGKPIKNFFNNTARLVTYEPNGQDTLSKLIRGEISSEEARGIVDPKYVSTKTKPTPAPATEPTVDTTTVPTAVPTVEINVDATTVPTAEPTVEPTVDATTVPTTVQTVEIKVEVTPVPTAEPTVEPTADATTVTTAEPSVEIKVEVTTVPTTEPTTEPTVEVSTIPQAQSASKAVPLITPETFDPEPAAVTIEPAKISVKQVKKPIEKTEPSQSIFNRFLNLFQRRDTSEVKPLPIPSPVVETPVIQPVIPVIPVPQPEVSPQVKVEKKETPSEETKKLDEKETASSSSLPAIALPEAIETENPKLASPETPTLEPKSESEKTVVEKSTKSDEVPAVVEIAPTPNVPLTLPEAIEPATSQPETITEPKIELKETPIKEPTKSDEKETESPAIPSVIEASTPAVPLSLPKAIAPATPQVETITEPKIELKETPIKEPTKSDEKEAKSISIPAVKEELPSSTLPPTLPEILEKSTSESSTSEAANSKLDSSPKPEINSPSPVIPLIQATEPLEIPQRYIEKLQESKPTLEKSNPAENSETPAT